MFSVYSILIGDCLGSLVPLALGDVSLGVFYPEARLPQEGAHVGLASG